jgi:ketosteroid isomerase-like protein
MTQHEHPNVAVVREGFEAMQRGDTAWIDQHLADDVVWHVGGNSKWAGAYQGKQNVLEFFARQTQSTDGPPSVDIHDILGNDDHVVVLGSARATARDGSSAEWKYIQVSTSGTGRRPRSGGWPRTTPRSTRSWTACLTERRPGLHGRRSDRAGRWRGSALARRVPLRGGRNARPVSSGPSGPTRGQGGAPAGRPLAPVPSQLAGDLAAEDERP